MKRRSSLRLAIKNKNRIKKENKKKRKLNIQDNESTSTTIDTKTGRFIGGAERARRKAQKRENKKSWKLNETNNRLPKRIKASERFYASLLQHEIESIINSSSCDEVWNRFMDKTCGCLGIPTPKPLPLSYSDKNEYYTSLVSLVMEESRCVLVEALKKQRQRHCFNTSYRENGHELNLVSSEKQEKSGFVSMTFSSLYDFTPKQLYDMKPGCIFEVTSLENSQRQGVSFLASVVPIPKAIDNSNFDSTKNLKLMMFSRNPLYIETLLNLSSSQRFHVFPLATLISEQRQFEACMKAPNVSFMNKILGMKSPTHLRFEASDDSSSASDNIDVDQNPGDDVVGDHDTKVMIGDIEKKDDIFNENPLSNMSDMSSGSLQIPQLNESQVQAAMSFLHSSSSSITLVQGPPGTGKTTFMTSVLCKCFFQTKDNGSFNVDNQKRIMVAAPTNKAITVLASRFLKALNGFNKLNVVLIGVEDKLISDGSFGGSQLKGIFVYSWIEEIKNRYSDILDMVTKYVFETCTMIEMKFMASELSLLKDKLKQSIPVQGRKTDLIKLAEQALSQFKKLPTEKVKTHNYYDEFLSIKGTILTLHATLRDIEVSNIIDELLATAHVIFCTLSSSGVSAVKRTKAIDDLFVDEAAATTEAEIIIPFHLRPKRLLMVGDPKQLPATITSQKAANFGLNKSLLDRLMNDTNNDHVMLDVQYRMRPDIAAFPNKQFYENKLNNSGTVTNSNYMGSISTVCRKGCHFFDVKGAEKRSISGSYQNIAEANKIIGILHEIRKKSERRHPFNNKHESPPWYSEDKIRIITFYQGQVACIKQMLYHNGLGKVMVATVDSSQGSEADIVIISFVRSNRNSFVRSDTKQNVRANAGFLDDDRRINVALTRAKYHLICVGNLSHLYSSGAPTLKAMVNDVKERNLTRYHGIQFIGTDQTINSSCKINSTQTKDNDMSSSGLPHNPSNDTVHNNSPNDEVCEDDTDETQPEQKLLIETEHKYPKSETKSSSTDSTSIKTPSLSKTIKQIEQKLKSLRQQLPFVQSDLMEKKRIRTEIERIQQELLSLNDLNKL